MKKKMENTSKNKPKIAIACQGGGSQTVFTAGVLKTFFENNVHKEVNIIGLSGTSGGALNAALAWYGLLKTAQGDTKPIGERIAEFWQDLSAQHPLEILFDHIVTESMRMISSGLLPKFEHSPAERKNQWMTAAISKMMPRERYMNFRGLLEDHIKFDEIVDLMEPNSPALLIGAANVLKGNMKIFNSRKKEFRIEAILASAAIPTIYPAVHIGEDYYWDGLFSANPPINELMRSDYMGEGNDPDEVWIILINPFTRKTLPTAPEEVVDRRNQMIGNVSLLQELKTMELINSIIVAKGFTEEFAKERGYIYDTKPFKVRFIQMSEEVQESLDYPSKLSRNPQYMRNLMEHGEKQAITFLEDITRPAGTIEEEVASKLKQKT